MTAAAIAADPSLAAAAALDAALQQSEPKVQLQLTDGTGEPAIEQASDSAAATAAAADATTCPAQL